MSLLKKLRDRLAKSGEYPARASDSASGKGLLLFEHTSDVIRAENCLKKAGLDVKVKGPPPEIRTGCDLAIEFPIILQMRVVEVLGEQDIVPLKVVSLKDVLIEPVSLYHVKDFGEYVMVRAANMKITLRKADRIIVNISGGGCPDVPYLAEQLVGKSLEEAPAPRTIGQTLCGYALQLAYEELLRICPGR